jgi:pyridoxal phosphate enzyme (YggS family)
MNDVSENLKDVRARMIKVAREYDVTHSDVTLVAVSKMQPPERIEAALAAGQRVFGENRVQEAQGRWETLKQQYPDIVLHLIGSLQTNKAKEAVALFDVIESVDRADIARALAKEMKKQGRMLPCFIQVNTGAEEQKAGVLPQELSALLGICREEGLIIEGLMCIPPIDEPPALHFAFLRKLAKELGLEKLSMGMSADYEKAVPLGATHVRVGTAIFGER